MNLDNKTLIHIGGELIIIGGIVFWYNKKFNALQEHITNLEAKVSRLENVLAAHDKFLENIANQGNNQRRNEGQNTQKKKTKTKADLEFLDNMLKKEIEDIEECTTEKCDLKKRKPSKK